MFKKNLNNSEQNIPADKILSRDATKALQEMMVTIDALRGVLVRETQALDNADNESFMLLQEHKVSLAREYQSGISQLLSRKDEIRLLADPAAKARLSIQQAEFHDTVELNRERLDRMRKSFSRIGERIMSVARETVKKETQFAYGASGQMQQGAKGSIGINEKA
ncbi:MAG: hypothetical protein J0L77_04035 [Alphaproteobacteria bacterium]|nr:hypothetical protein [Alphaproteobacteria bacterium]